MYVSLDVLIVIDDTANVLDFNRYLRSYVSMKCVIFIVYFAVSFVITSFSGKIASFASEIEAAAGTYAN